MSNTRITLKFMIVTTLVANLAYAQRSSPQFSFPPPGADVFSTAGQDIGLGQTSVGSLGRPQLMPLAPPSIFNTQSSPDQSQLLSQSLSLTPAQPPATPSNSPSPVQTLPQRQAESTVREPQSIQLSRPSLALNSIAPSQPQPSQQQAPQPSRSSQSPPAGSFSSPSQVSAPTQVAPARHQTQATNHKHNHQQQSNSQSSQHQRSQSNIHSSSANNKAQTKDEAIDAARKAEATAASLAASSGHNYQCPDSFGYFRHHKSCDKYWACENGTSTLKLCGNGLMFDDSDSKRENCAYPFSVDCGADRTDLEPPISTPHCPRLYGLFADSSNCRIFYSCWNGESSKYECPPGLAYDNEQRVCVWADLVDRCDQSEVSDGFVCPDPTEADQPGHYTRHAHPTDCRKFYVCIEGVARPYGCSLGTVFNVDSLQCDEPENVSGCEKYYGDMDPKLAKKLAREGVQGNTQSSSSSGSQSSSSRSTNQSNSSN